MATTSKGTSAKKSGSTTKSGAKSKTDAKPNSRSTKSTGGTKSSTATTAPGAKPNTAAKASAKSSKVKGSDSNATTRTTKSGNRAGADNVSRAVKPAKAAKNGSRKGGDGVVSKVLASVTGLLTSDPADAVNLLKADHDKVEELFEKVKANEDGNNKAVFTKIKTELDAHARIEEKIFYPFLLEKGNKDLQKLVREGLEEHRQAKTLLSELGRMTGTSEKFRARIKVLMEDIEHHVQEEEDEMFAMVRSQFDGDTLRSLGEKMRAEKAKLKKRATAAKQASR